MDFARLIAPLGVDRFLADHYGAKPLHLPATEQGRGLLDWHGMNGLLGLRSHWSEANLKLIMNSRPVDPSFYMDEVESAGGRARRANPAKVELFLAMGASLVANAVEDVSADIRALASALSETFGGRVGANIYCSFKGVQAFASHCDPHEVFAVQCEGEKLWNVYENRAASPVENLEGSDAQALIDRAKGGIAMQVRMRPGDLLYIPRGFYHDAIALEESSLHVTFGIAPLTGRALFRLLEQAAVEEEAFRRYLPDGRDEGALEEALEALAARAAEILRSRRIRAELADWQRSLREPNFAFRLPERPELEFYARTDRPAELRRTDAGAVVATAGGEVDVSALAGPAEWVLQRPAVSLQELAARFPHLTRDALRGLVTEFERLGLLYPYTPDL